MIAAIVRWIIIILSFINSAYMLYDGSRALITGDYMHPESGEYAGQLGPWTKIVAAVGIDPVSPLMKTIFVLFGLAGLSATAGFAFGRSWGWAALLLFNALCLWNLFAGTLICALAITLLFIYRAITK